MAVRLLRLGVVLAFAAQAFSTPTPKGLPRRQECAGQSCTIAALSGSSGQPYGPSVAPTGGSDAGDCCILTYNPSAASVLFAEKPALQAECAATKSKMVQKRELDSNVIENIKRAACAPYTLIFARGTTEIGTLGETVGPALSLGLNLAAPGKWSIQGVNYQATVDGDNCLGLPGGSIAAQQLEQVASSCPSTKIVMSGYSEGAMVAHNVRSKRKSNQIISLLDLGRGICLSSSSIARDCKFMKIYLRLFLNCVSSTDRLVDLRP